MTYQTKKYESSILKIIKQFNKNRSKLYELEKKYEEKPSRSIANKIEHLQYMMDISYSILNEENGQYEIETRKHYDQLFKDEDIYVINKELKRNNHINLLNEIDKQKNVLVDLSLTYNELKNKLDSTTKTQKKKKEQINNDIKQLKEKIQVENDNFDLLIHQNKTYQNLSNEIGNKLKDILLKRYEQQQKEKKTKKQEAIIKQKETIKKKKEQLIYTLTAMLFYKLSDTEIESFYDLKTNNKAEFNKKYHGYVLGKKAIDNSARNDIYIKFTKGKDQLSTVKAINKINEFNNKRMYSDDEHFNYILKVLKTDKDLDKFIDMVCESRGIDLIILKNIQLNTKQNGTNPNEEVFHESLSNDKMFFKYIDYDSNDDSTTFKDLFKTDKKYDDYKINSCFLNLIISTYREKITGRYYKSLTFESLCNILQVENLDQNIGITLKQSVSFFKKYKLGLFVLDRNYDIVFYYEPETYTKNINPRALYCVFDNHHIYQLNDDVSSLSHIVHNKIHKNAMEKIYKEDIPIYNNYKFRKFDVEEKTQTIFIENLNDICTYIKNNKNKNIRFCASNQNIHNILFYLVNECKYVPQIQVVSNELRKIFFKVKKQVYSIMCDADDNNDNNLNVDIDNENEYNTYYECDKEIYLWMINRDNMSHTNDDFINIEEEYKIAPMSGYFNDIDLLSDDSYCGIDCVKAYTSCLMDMAYFPVFNLFDQWLIYQNEPIEDFSQYIIEVTDDLERMDVKILFTQKYSRCYGYKLNRIKDIKYNICYVRKPSKLNKTNSHDYLRKLYNNPNISIQNKKFIINKNTGLIEKKYNKTAKAGIYKSLDDAHYYKNKLGGQIFYLRNCSDEDIDEYHDLSDNHEKLYLHKVTDQKHLHEVFKPIKDLIYEVQTLKNYQLYKKLEESNVNIPNSINLSLSIKSLNS